MKNSKAPEWFRVKVQDPFFAPGMRAAHESTIPVSIRKCEETGRIEAFKLNWKPGMPNQPHVYWDSDVAKVAEGMAYDLVLHPDDTKLAAQLDDMVSLIVSAQQADGYLNTHFTVVEPENRWKWLHWAHELYCCGHLIEAAVAHFKATGKRNFLDAVCRYADYVDSVFGPEENKKHGYPGHEEIELALCKLGEVTGNEKYWKLAKYFIDERGKEPRYFEVNEGLRHQDSGNIQAHKPVREQTEATGHSVRAGYLYSGMADIASHYHDEELFHACEKLFDSIAEHRMYITGGIGSTQSGEAFEEDYKLPNYTAYAESCAAIALVLFASRMLNITGEMKYADVMERAMYNGIPSGISLKGDEFFYQNMLEVNSNVPFCRTRQAWFGCSCCPTNFCRFLPQTGSFLWSESENGVRLNIPAAGSYENGDRKIRVEGNYPYDGAVKIRFESDAEYEFSFRVPAWCPSASAKLNGNAVNCSAESRCVILNRPWKKGDVLELLLDMPVQIVRANPHVRADAGKIALQRGPLVYALESTENGTDLQRLLIPANQDFKLTSVKGLPEGAAAIQGNAFEEWSDCTALYSTAPRTLKPFVFTAIPYALWQNRGEAEMQVWIREK